MILIKQFHFNHNVYVWITKQVQTVAHFHDNNENNNNNSIKK